MATEERSTRARPHDRRSCGLALVLLSLLFVSCQPARPPQPLAPLAPTVQPTPAPVRLPADDAPHDVLTEWWYYTGHLYGADGQRYGFEFVIFQSVRGQNPIGYLAHVALTDPQRGRFRYAARTAQRTALPASLDLEVDGWRLSGGDGRDQIAADLDDYALELRLVSQKPPALHHGGLISFGPAGDSYYYSRTRLAVSGQVREGDTWRQVEGQAWHDHQWGNFVVATVGGWDWFSLQLDEGSELMLFLLRDAQGASSGVFGTVVDRAGQTTELPADAAEVAALGSWTSPHTGARYPSGWEVRLAARPELGLPQASLRLVPVLEDQELAFERMPYWEGAVQVSGTLGGRGVAGEGYVELTGYRPG
ncbi:MAG: hypothetical protein HY690_20205 [Chloroflexi bacterium]|nr:hypothetical protein [Chloroflexota bacterium]